jgi:hypothetical protein
MAIISMTIASASASLLAAFDLRLVFCIVVMVPIGPYRLATFNTSFWPKD